MISKQKKVYPNYKGYSLVNLMSSILAHFGLDSEYLALDNSYLENIQNCETLIFFFIDGFGQNIWEEYAIQYPLFNELNKNMKNNSITTVFPSTTSAALTTTHTGLPSLDHGVIEWNVYFKEYNAVLSPLSFKTVSSIYKPQNYDLGKNLIINNTTVYEKLLKHQVQSYVYYPKQFINGIYNHEALKGAQIREYILLPDLFIDLLHLLSTIEGKSYIYIYWPYLDTTEHYYGPYSEQTDLHIEMLHYLFKEQFIGKLSRKSAKKTGLLISADHGHITSMPKKHVYLNEIIDLSDYLGLTADNNLILPSGNARDIFLHIQPDKLEECYKKLSHRLQGFADILLLDQISIKKLFGETGINSKYVSRIGDIVILPKNNNTLTYKYTDKDRFKYKGTHGGLSEDEMLIPVISADLSHLL